MKTFLLTLPMLYASINYHDYVRITDGFYKGCTGTVTMKVAGTKPLLYVVDLNKDSKGYSTHDTAVFEATQLEIIK